ncbi:MAG: hypothetical protein IKC51_10650 [Myxococcaceae bacterium]|nr:hypothetical protein [Myxococcaceae bacterium]
MESDSSTFETVFSVILLLAVLGVRFLSFLNGGNFFGTSRRRRRRAEYLDDSEPAPFRLVDDFPDVAPPEPAVDIIGEKFTALKVGPFNAQIKREMTSGPDMARMGPIATSFTVHMLPVASFGFTIEFPQTNLYAEDGSGSFDQRLHIITCAEQELRSLILSGPVLMPLRALSGMGAGRVSASGNTFTVTIFRGFNDEAALDNLYAEAYSLFQKYAQLLQFNVRDWRANAAQYDWWAN